jgi:hypothetical protein
MANPSKDTIYVDIDDEITGVIDKVQNSSSKLVALVLPKRASVFQSIVNMKLLKRAADSGKKNIVLITSEAGLLPLAGAAGVHVAKTLNSKPEIPLGPDSIIDGDEAVDEDAPLSTELEDEEPLDANKSVGALAGATSAKPSGAKGQDVETLTLDNSEPEEAAAGAAAADAAGSKKTPKKNKSLKVPNFNRFRLILGILGLLLLLFIIGFFVLSSTLGKATIKISTNASNVPVSLDMNLSTTATSLDTNNSTVPAQYVQSQKTFTEQVPTTGQKNEGNKASGTMTVTVSGQCGSFGVPQSIPAGTGATANNQTYIIDDEVTFTSGTISHGNCQFTGTDATNNSPNIPITAQSGGSSYNVSGVTFAITGYSNYSASGSASGGTDNIVQVVNQNDITSAENKISTGNAGTVKSALEGQLQGEGYYPLDATFSPGTPTTTSSASVGSAANTVTVTENVTYSMFGAHKSDLQNLIANSIKGQINSSTQSILDYGLSNANISVNSQTTKTAQVSLSTTAIAGPHLDIATIKKEAAGKKAGDIQSAISSNPNVTGVKVSFSPFWASSAPSNVNKINVVIAKPTNK